MRKAGGGDVINISSESAAHPFPYLVPYAATKAGLEALSQGLMYELREDGIRVTTIRVGGMEGTAEQSNNWDEEDSKAFYGVLAQSGHLWSSGNRMDPATVTRAIVDTICLPGDARVDLMVIRGSSPR